jgi:hypothetical protein
MGGLRVTDCGVILVNLQDRREGGQGRSRRSLSGMLSCNTIGLFIIRSV